MREDVVGHSLAEVHDPVRATEIAHALNQALATGRPVRFSSSSRRMVRRRLVESATHSTRSGTVSPVALPSTKARC